MKTCRSCGRQGDPVVDFGLDRSTKDQRAHSCKPCLREKGRRRFETNGEVIVQRNTAKRYGLSHEEYVALHEAQANRCAVCGQEETATYRGVPKRLCVDHNHETNVIRGLLCNNCNRAIGMLKDDPLVLERAAAYLRSHRGF